MNLTQIRINKKQYDLLEPLRKGYNVKHHNIENSAINLSTQGRQVWYQAHKDGLWEIIRTIPKSFCLEFEPITHFFRSHIFLSRTKYNRHLKKVELTSEMSLENKNNMKDEKDDDLSRGVQRLEQLEMRSSHRTRLIW